MADPVVTFQKNKTEEVRVGLTTFHGRELLDVRVFAEFRDGGPHRKPTKAGLSLRVEQIPELQRAIQAVAAEAARRGLISLGDAG